MKRWSRCLITNKRCEKKANGADYVWLVANDFDKEKKDNLKLLDGIGQLVENEHMNYLLMESSGYVCTKPIYLYLLTDLISYQSDIIISHSLNDTLKNIKNGHDNLKYFISHYRNASITTMKKIHLFSCQIIENKMTLIKYAVQSPKKWSVIECRSASMPRKLKDSLHYMKVFELFAFLFVSKGIDSFGVNTHPNFIRMISMVKEMWSSDWIGRI